jgi:hypothetical protein
MPVAISILMTIPIAIAMLIRIRIKIRTVIPIVIGMRGEVQGLRACLKIPRDAVFAEKAGWRGATREDIRSDLRPRKQRSQTVFSAKTLRAAVLLAGAGVGSSLTAHFRDTRASPPWPRPKSLAAASLGIFKQALRFLSRTFSFCRQLKTLPSWYGQWEEFLQFVRRTQHPVSDNGLE